MNTLKLESKNTAEARVLEYLTANASDALAAKINAGTKTLTQAMNYCNTKARKEAEKGATVACVDEATVYGWAVHFFEEDNPTAGEADSDEPDGNRTDADDEDDEGGTGWKAPVEPSVRRAKKESAQAELDLFGGEADDE